MNDQTKEQTNTYFFQAESVSDSEKKTEHSIYISGNNHIFGENVSISKYRKSLTEYILLFILLLIVGGIWVIPYLSSALNRDYPFLQTIEDKQNNIDREVNRILSQTNYMLQTNAVKKHLIPKSAKKIKSNEYAEEADFLNLAVFSMTAKEWKNKNPERAEKGENLRDTATAKELFVLSLLQNLNARMIQNGLGKQERFEKLKSVAKEELSKL